MEYLSEASGDGGRAASARLPTSQEGTALPHVDQVIRETLEMLIESLEVGLVFLARISNETLRIEHVRDTVGMNVTAGRAGPLAGTYCETMLETASQALVVPDALLDPAFAERESTCALGIGAYSGVAIYRSDGSLYGTLCTLHPTARDPRQHEITMLRMAGRSIVQAIESDVVREREHALLQEMGATARRLRYLYDSMPCGVLVLDSGGMINEANSAALDLFGLESDELIGRALEQIHLGPLVSEEGVPLSDQERPELQAIETLQPIRRVIGMVRLDGQHRWLECDALPIVDRSSDLEAVMLSFFDISARFEAESQRRLSEQRFRALVEHAPISMCITDEEGRIETFNEAFAALYGYRREELIRQPVTVLVPADQREAAMTRYLQDLHSESSVQREEEVGTRAGEALVLLSTTIPLPGSTGQRARATFSVDITQRKQTELQMRHLAHFDAVTGLPNRILFQERLGRTLHELQQHGQRVAVFFLDLDGFKAVNDRYGHDTGDLLLREVAGRLRRCTRETDLVARLAGDEFTAIVQHLENAATAAIVARKILVAIQDGFTIRGQEISVTVSVGISIAPDNSLDPTVLLEQADAAMYRAKHRGKNSFCFFTESN